MKLLELAEHYLRHEFDVLGSGWVRCYYGMRVKGFEGKDFFRPWSVEQAEAELPACHGELHGRLLSRLTPGYVPIDWQIDLRSGERFSAGVHHSQLAYGVVEGVDAKVSADLGRLYQLPVLGQAYARTGDAKFRREVLDQLSDFLAFNAPEYGAAWRANMNVSIRAANILVALELIGEPLAGVWRSAIEVHGDYIAEHLEFPETVFHPNHFIANLAGLLMVGAALGREDWQGYACRTLAEQILEQSGADGANYEGATSYHCFVTEMIAQAALYAARQAGVAPDRWLVEHFSVDAVERFSLMFDVAHVITMPNGDIPIIGDNDSGRFLLMGDQPESKSDWRFLFEQERRFFPRKTPLEHPGSTALRNVGYYVMRDADDALFITCGPIGTGGKGGHAHNDKLAFTLQLHGLDIFVDPGVYVYTASRYYRELFRATASHNTLQIGDWEQNRRGEKSVWWGMCDDTRCELLSWNPFYFCGRHRGFCRFPEGACHQRTIEWHPEARAIRLTDELDRACDRVTAHFMLHEEVVMVGYTPRRVILRRGPVRLTLTASQGEWLTEGTFISHGYGTKSYTQKLTLHWEPGTATNRIEMNYEVE